MTNAERLEIKEAAKLLAQALDRIEEVAYKNEDFHNETYEAHKNIANAWSKFEAYTKQ